MKKNYNYIYILWEAQVVRGGGGGANGHSTASNSCSPAKSPGSCAGHAGGNANDMIELSNVPLSSNQSIML